ncbi:hypothetical protein CKS97_19835 [Salmonella enterica subsp. enterica serovar Java]|nr:hypothetical protein [Salmonella enterica subsp. enterica serovar Java]
MSTIVEFNPMDPAKRPTGRYAKLPETREQFLPLLMMRGIKTDSRGLIGTSLFMYRTEYPVPASWVEVSVEDLLKTVY